MALANRLSRLFQADFHAVLDRIEEPDLQLRQAVREMQFAFEQDRQRLKLLRQELEQLDNAAATIDTGLENYDEELDLCLAAKKDDLARDLIRRRLAAEKRGQVIRQQSDAITARADRLEKQIDEQARQLTSMKQKLELLVDDESVATGEQMQSDVVRNEEIEIALLREKQRRAGA